MSWYRDRILPHVIEHAASTGPLMKQRERVVPLASGRVLEVGFGTGLNMAYYDRAKVEKVFALDPFMHLPDLAAERVARSGLDVELVRARAEDIPFDDGTFDTVLRPSPLPCPTPECSAPVQAAAGSSFANTAGARTSVRRWRHLSRGECISGGCHLDQDV